MPGKFWPPALDFKTRKERLPISHFYFLSNDEVIVIVGHSLLIRSLLKFVLLSFDFNFSIDDTWIFNQYLFSVTCPCFSSGKLQHHFIPADSLISFSRVQLTKIQSDY